MKKTELQKIPGVGAAMERMLLDLGYTTIESLKGQDPQDMYERSCILAGQRLDRCVLYVYRLCVYFAGHNEKDPQKLRWWYWKEHDDCKNS